MRSRRRPIVALFATLLVWLTSVSSTRTVVSHEKRLLGATGDAVPTISAAVPRTTAIASRETTRLPALTGDTPGFLPERATLSLVARTEAWDTHAVHSRVRQSLGIAWTYDATAPPPVVENRLTVGATR